MTSYPLALDSNLELPLSENGVTELTADTINSVRDAVMAIEKAIGTSPAGNMQDLVTRINLVIDEDGHLKSSALSTLGLVTLPISNSQIATNANISESKIDLDYSTTTLKALIDDKQTNIDATNASLSTFSVRMINHYAGTSDKHDGYDIDTTETIRGVSTVEEVLHNINNALTDHETDLNIVSHTASTVSVDNVFENISSTNVQDALEELDLVYTGKIEAHQTNHHTNAIQNNIFAESGDQGDLVVTTLASTIFQTDKTVATNILQVMRPNVARVTSKGIDFRALKIGVATTLRIQAGGVDRTYLDIDISSVIPTQDIDIIVAKINTVAQSATNHYPISAYNTGGRLTIAHNIPGYNFTIAILDTVSLSAATALGFEDVITTTFYWPEEKHAAYINGNRIVGLKSLLKIQYTHADSVNPNKIDPALGDLSSLGLDITNNGRILCNITNHSSASSANGTYYIASFPSVSTFLLNTNIALGDFDLEIAADSLSFINNTKGNIYDIFLERDADGYGIISKQTRVQYDSISNVVLRTINKEFPINNIEWEVTSDDYIILYEDNVAGLPVQIPAGFSGNLKVFAPDNISSAIFETYGSPSHSREDMTVYACAESSDLLYLSSVHFCGNLGFDTLKYVTDKRKIGNSIENLSQDILNTVPLTNALDSLRNNGVLEGLDVISNTTSTIKIRGGRVLVSGNILSVPTTDVVIDDFTFANNILMVDSAGHFIVKNEFDAGYTFDDLTSGNNYGDNINVVPILQFETDGVEVDGYLVDKRLIVSKIDKQLLDIETDLNNKIEQVQNTVSGSMWGITIASADGYIAELDPGAHNGFDAVTYGVVGFMAGNNSTTRVFEFNSASLIAYPIFFAPGLTYANIFVETEYTGGLGGPFGASGTAYIEVGIAAKIGIDSVSTYDEYCIVKTLTLGVLPSDSVVEKYVVSIPLSLLDIDNDIMFKLVPRIKIVNSTLIDGGTGDDPEPVIAFNNVRVVTSSYSIAGHINQISSDTSQFALLGDVL
ncbi:MAG: hypothetical protein WC523_00600 [Patescibacteria group bacterium]